MGKIFVSKNEPKIGFFEFIGKFSYEFFSAFGLWRKFILIAVFLYKSCTWEKSSSWDMGQNVLTLSDCKIFKSTVFLEKNAETLWFFAGWYRLMEIKGWSKGIGVGVIKNGSGHFGLRALKLAVSQEGINWIHWFLVCWWKFRKAKSCFNNFWVVVVNNICGFSISGL